MAITDTDILEGRLVISERPSSLCYGKPWEFVSNLVKILKISFPVALGSRFTIVGPNDPGPDNTGSLWAKTDKNLNPEGWFHFSKGQWRKFFTLVKGEIRWVVGDSASPPEGWVVVTTGTPGVPAQVANVLRTRYVEHPSIAGKYIYFAVKYVGY